MPCPCLQHHPRALGAAASCQVQEGAPALDARQVPVAAGEADRRHITTARLEQPFGVAGLGHHTIDVAQPAHVAWQAPFRIGDERVPIRRLQVLGLHVLEHDVQIVALAAKQAPPAKPSPLQPRPQPFPQLAAATRRLEMDLHPCFPQHVFDEAQVTTQTDAIVPTDQVHARHRSGTCGGAPILGSSF